MQLIYQRSVEMPQQYTKMHKQLTQQAPSTAYTAVPSTILHPNQSCHRPNVQLTSGPNLVEENLLRAEIVAQIWSRAWLAVQLIPRAF